MFEKLKDIFYDISDYVVTIIIVFFIVISIGFIMTKSYGLEFSKNDLLSFFQKGGEKETVVTITPTEKENSTTDTTISPITSTPTEGTTTSPSTTTTPGTTTTPEQPKDVTVQVDVNEGDGAYAIGERLVENGVIKDADEFVNELVNRGLDASVRVGEYTFKKDMTMDEVFNVLFE